MTIQYALAGFPIERSPSPVMHNAAFAELGMDACYQLRPTQPKDIDAVLGDLNNHRLAGINVTTPLKVHMGNRVTLRQEAIRAGCVNTVWLENNKLVGCLTDVDGVMQPILQRRSITSGLVIGSGGAARAAILALDGLGAKVHVAARRASGAKEVLDVVQPKHTGCAIALEDTPGAEQGSLGAVLESVQCIVQATPVGANGDRHLLPWHRVVPGTLAFDMVYFPRRTPFLSDAVAAGCEAIEGWEMLVAQGAASFSVWTGHPAPLLVMKNAVQGHLRSLETA